MKQVTYIFLGMFLFALILTGCDTNSNEIPSPTPVEGFISVLPQTELKNVQPAPSTKAGNDARLTYTFEVWTSGSDSRCVLHRTATGTLSGGTSFEISLVPGTYDLLFWADYGTEDYITTNLQAVKRKTTPYTAGVEGRRFQGYADTSADQTHHAEHETFQPGSSGIGYLRKSLYKLQCIDG